MAVTVLKVEDDFGLSLGRPEQLPLYVSSISRLVAGALLVVGGAAAVNMFRSQPRTRRTMLVPTVAFTVALIVLYLIREQITTFDTLLPPFIGPVGIKQIITEPRFAGAMLDVTSIALLIQAVSAALFLVGVSYIAARICAMGPSPTATSPWRCSSAHCRIRFYFYPGGYTVRHYK